ncbi:MAG: hypothetical protein WD794_13270 [Mycobacteriales bacterium]
MSSDSAPGTASPDRDGPGGGSPPGGYDPGWVAATARSADPGLPEETARELAIYAGEHLHEIAALDAPEVARRLLAEHRTAGATAAAVVAKAAVDFCEAYGVQP